MNQIYSEILAEIHQLISEGKANEALAKINNECAMPYIPFEVETALLEMKKTVSAQIELNKNYRVLSDEEIRNYLQGNINQQMSAVVQLSERNVRSYLELIQDILTNNPPILLRAMIIELLISQQIRENVVVYIDGMEITFDPSLIEQPMESDGAVASLELLKEWFENENPSFLAMCCECLVRECYLRLPFNIDEDESEALSLAIIAYVFKANNAEDELNSFIQQKSLANIGSFELLLDKHDI